MISFALISCRQAPILLPNIPHVRGYTMSATHKTENAARRFRVWKRTHRSSSSYADLAKETGIPEIVVKRIITANDSSVEYAQHITTFLDAVESGNTKLLLKLVKQEDVLPAAHVPTRYTPKQIIALKQRQRDMCEDEVTRPYCLIVKKNVSVRQCLTTQNCNDCTGCGAGIRYCAECGYDTLAFAGSELCSFCLTLALADPDTDAPTQVLPVYVKCLQSGGSKISVATCRRMQNDSCNSCSAISRICGTCRERQTRYPSSGQCLRCHTETWNFDGWEPFDDKTVEKMKGQRDEFFMRAEMFSIETHHQAPQSTSVFIEVSSPQPTAITIVVQPVATNEIEHGFSKFLHYVVGQPNLDLRNGSLMGLLWPNAKSSASYEYKLSLYIWDAVIFEIIRPGTHERLVSSLEELQTKYYYLYPRVQCSRIGQYSMAVCYARRIAELMLSMGSTAASKVYERMGNNRFVKSGLVLLETCKIQEAKRSLSDELVEPQQSTAKYKRPLLVTSIDQVDERLGIRKPFWVQTDLIEHTAKLRRMIKEKTDAGMKPDLESIWPELHALLGDERVLGTEGAILLELLK